jgi:hypothetical protein
VLTNSSTEKHSRYKLCRYVFRGAQYADYADEPTIPCAFNRLHKCLGTAHFNDLIYTFSVCKTQDRLVPVRSGNVVDEVRSTE